MGKQFSEFLFSPYLTILCIVVPVVSLFLFAFQYLLSIPISDRFVGSFTLGFNIILFIQGLASLIYGIISAFTKKNNHYWKLIVKGILAMIVAFVLFLLSSLH